METLVQNRPVAFHAITLSEAIVMAPLMDEFKEFTTEEAENQMPHPVNKEGEEDVYIVLKKEQVKRIAFILSKLGFRTSSGEYFGKPAHSEPSLNEPSACDVFQDMMQKEINEVK